MFNSEDYRESLAGAVNLSDKEDRKDLLEGESRTPEYKIAKILKELEDLSNKKSHLEAVYRKAKRSLQDIISPRFNEVEEKGGYRYSQSAGSEAFGNSVQINFEGMTSIMRAVTDDDFRQKVKDLFKASDEALEAYKDAINIYEEKYKQMRNEVRVLGGEDEVYRKLIAKRDLLTAYQLDILKNDPEKRDKFGLDENGRKVSPPDPEIEQERAE